MKALRLRETCTQYKVTRNVYGDTILTQIGTLLCLFRNVSKLTEAEYREDMGIDGLFWFSPSTSLKQGDVVGIYGNLYRITGINVARQRLTSDAIHFYKCNAQLLRQLS